METRSQKGIGNIEERTMIRDVRLSLPRRELILLAKHDNETLRKDVARIERRVLRIETTLRRMGVYL